MKDTLLQAVRDFLKDRTTPDSKPLLLGYSGGPDSKALLHLILACRFPLPLHLAHVDHGWREESGREAEELRKEGEKLGLPFHLQRLTPDPDPHNLEAKGREARVNFFQRVYREIDAQGLVLAHQADDQAETVLKRIFEGAHLRNAGGIQAESDWGGMRVLRPLLSCRKQQLVRWLEEKGLQAFQDPTNSDPKFLRGRMRTHLLPLLAESFGKEVAGNLCRLGAVAHDLSAYFSSKLAHCFSTLHTTPTGIHWDLSGYTLEKIEWEYLLREWVNREGLALSFEMFHSLVAFVREKGSERCLTWKTGKLTVDQGCISLIKTVDL